ncbi:MAG: hypothetical protein EPN99_06075 [Frankiales bacterium]|nr:MAG: hypothetical protein EPN99_06075 [Frankiales bacterium]
MRFYAEVLLALVVSGVGVVAALLGETDDAPGLVGVGCLLVAGAVLLGVRAGRRSRDDERGVA